MKKEKPRFFEPIKWDKTQPALTVADLKKYVNSLRVFLSYEDKRKSITVSESAAILAEIEAWSNFFGILNRIKQ